MNSISSERHHVVHKLTIKTVSHVPTFPEINHDATPPPAFNRSSFGSRSRPNRDERLVPLWSKRSNLSKFIKGTLLVVEVLSHQSPPILGAVKPSSSTRQPSLALALAYPRRLPRAQASRRETVGSCMVATPWVARGQQQRPIQARVVYRKRPLVGQLAAIGSAGMALALG